MWPAAKGREKVKRLSSVRVVFLFGNSDWGARRSFPEMMQVKNSTKTLQLIGRGETHADALQMPKRNVCGTNPEMTTIRFARPNHVKIRTQTDSGL